MNDPKLSAHELLELRLYISFEELLSMVPLSGKTIERMIQRGDFPKPDNLVDGKRTWWAGDIKRWIKERQEGRAKGA